jgi:hypothetical protein
MLKAQLARALQLPMDTRAEQGLSVLLELEPADTARDTAAEERGCDRVIAILRARLAAR